MINYDIYKQECIYDTTIIDVLKKKYKIEY